MLGGWVNLIRYQTFEREDTTHSLILAKFLFDGSSLILDRQRFVLSFTQL